MLVHSEIITGKCVLTALQYMIVDTYMDIPIAIHFHGVILQQAEALNLTQVVIQRPFKMKDKQFA